MNADDRRSGDIAELAMLVPPPAEREIPAGRQQVLKDHLISHIRFSGGSPDAGRPAGRTVVPLRRKPAVVVAVAAAVLAAVVVVILRPWTPAGASPAAVRLLARIATAAAMKPSPLVRNSQFSYVKSRVAFEVCDGGGLNAKCVMQKPQDRQIWQSVANLCVTGLLRQDGHNIPLPFQTNYLRCPYRGGVHAPTYRFLQSLPTDPQALLTRIEKEMQGQLPPPEEAFTTIGDLLSETIPPPRVSAALYRAAALIPGVTVVRDATDAIGRHGVAVAFTYLGVRSEWIFSKRTLEYLGQHDIKLSDGSTTGVSAVLERAFVDHRGQIPG